MLCTNVIVVETLGLLLREMQDLPGSLGKLVKPVAIVHVFSPLSLLRPGAVLSTLMYILMFRQHERNSATELQAQSQERPEQIQNTELQDLGHMGCFAIRLIFTRFWTR